MLPRRSSLHFWPVSCQSYRPRSEWFWPIWESKKYLQMPWINTKILKKNKQRKMNTRRGHDKLSKIDLSLQVRQKEFRFLQQINLQPKLMVHVLQQKLILLKRMSQQQKLLMDRDSDVSMIQ